MSVPVCTGTQNTGTALGQQYQAHHLALGQTCPSAVPVRHFRNLEIQSICPRVYFSTLGHVPVLHFLGISYVKMYVTNKLLLGPTVPYTPVGTLCT